MSVGAHRLVGYVVEDRGYQGRFSVSGGVAGQDYWSLRDFVAVLANGPKTKAVRVVTEPVPPPKVRRGIETRWYREVRISASVGSMLIKSEMAASASRRRGSGA